MKKAAGFYFFCFTLLCLNLHGANAGAAGATLSELDATIEKSQWDEAVQLANDFLEANPNSSIAKLKGAYALFQGNHPNSALLLLSKIPAEDWKRLPQGRDRLVEVVALFQKKVPLNLLPSRLDQANLDEAPPYLKDEIRFAKGRQAFEKGQASLARELLGGVGEKSRLYGQARYLLGSLAVKSGDPKTAAAEFSKIFDSTVYEQSTEVWRDMSAQMTSHWGTNLKVRIDAALIADNTKAGELAVLGLARLNYANKDFKSALDYYARLSASSRFHARAALERVWTLLALGRHDQAEKEASELSFDEQTFESLEARTARGLILVDAGRSEEARQEIAAFVKAYEDAKRSLADYEASQGMSALPTFLKAELAQDMRLQSLIAYQDEAKAEIAALRAEDHALFPAYLKHAIAIEPLVSQAKDLAAGFVREHVRRRRVDLERLSLQAKLIMIETYLEDREKLRVEFRNLTENTEAKQSEHDERLAALLKRIVDSVDELLSGNRSHDPRLEFRQSEILWELSTATSILAQTKKDERQQQVATALRERSLSIAQAIVKKYPNFEKRSQALFFSGYALSNLNRIKESIDALQLYVRFFPRHHHVPDAYRILADASFDANDFAGAEKLYKKVLEFPESEIIGYALYKIGWCAYNLKDFARALLGLEKAVMWANAKNKGQQLLSLQREARHDLIVLYAEIGDHRKARAYFSQFLHDNSTEWLSELAIELDRIGQYEKSGDIYHLLIASEPAAKENISYQAAIIRGYHQLHRWPSVIEATQQLVERYKGILGDPKTEGAPELMAETVVREAVLTQHFEYRKRPTPESADRVASLDTLYLSAFENWATAEEPMYRYANLLIEQGKNAAAAKMFQKHWTQFKATLKEPLREESLRNVIHALEQEEAAVKPTGVTLLSRDASALLEFALEYETSYPNEKYTRTIAFLRPAILFKYGQIDDAIMASQKLFDANPVDEIGKRCFQNLRQAYYQKKNWEETYKWSTDLSSRKSAGIASYAADLKAIREESLFLWAQNTTDDGKSVELFRTIAENPDMRRLREKSLYNAYVRVQKAGQKLKAIELSDELEKTAPHFDGLNSIAGMRAATFQDAGDYARAFPLLERFIKNPDKGVGADSLTQARVNAGLIAEALGKTEVATRYFKEAKSVAAASLGLQRLQAQADKARSPKEFAKWPGLVRMRQDFERRPVPSGSDLVVRIKRATTAFEALTGAYLAVATEKDTPTYYAFEAYCTVPILYDTFSRSILALSDSKSLQPKEADELRAELRKITTPLDAKAKEFADQCLAKSAEVEHESPAYLAVSTRWGWRSDASVRARAERVLSALKKNAPWFDKPEINESEADVLKRHYEDRGSVESWYALARSRWSDGRVGLSRLTLVDALGKFPNSGKLMNLLAITESRTVQRIGPLFEKAGGQGSAAAWVNLALYHLEGARLASAIAALNHALESNTLDEHSEVKSLVLEFLKK